MKNMKKLFSLALALVMMMALVVTAGATSSATGSITVENASKGETYKLVKLFDASYNTETKAVVYSGDVPEALKAFFKQDAQGYVSAEEYNGPRNPDHSWKKDRERGRINKSKERGSEPWHEQCTARNLKQNWCWRY